MLVLVEPLNEQLSDRPDLGIAMLIASCRAKGIATSLVKGQTRILNDIFIHDSKELWHLICSLGIKDLKKLQIFDYKKLIYEKGLRQFCSELEREYNEIIINKSPRYYFNTPLLYRFRYLYFIFLKVYYYYLNTLRCDTLKIAERYVAEIKKNHPRYVGFSLNRFPNPFLLHIVKRIKKEMGIPIIAGGNFAHFISLKEKVNFFLENYFDYLIMGPAEYTLTWLIETLNDGKEPESIPNLCYKKNGKVKSNPLKTIGDLDTLPYPDFSEFDLDLYFAPKKILPLQTARGCFWGKCAFCDYYINYFGTYKTFSIGRVIECVKYLCNTYDCQHIMFHDEALSATRAVLISKALIENKMRHQFFYAYARFENKFVSSSTLSIMRKAGFVAIFWGLESGCQRVLDLMNKGIRISCVPKILRQASRHNIVNICMGFFGFPGESKEEAEKTVAFLRRNAKYIDIAELQVFILSSFSAIASNSHKWGLKVGSKGTYSVQSGMDFKEARSFLNILMAKVDVSTLELSSGELRLISDRRSGYCRYILSALSRRLGIMTHQKVRKLISENKTHRVYPLIPGTIGNQNRKIIFSPVRVNESIFINNRYPYKEMSLTAFERAIISFSDGTLSLEDIMSKVYERFGRGNKKFYIYKKCRKFFHEIFSKELGIAFRRPYQ